MYLPALTTKHIDVIRLYLSSEATRSPFGRVVILVSISRGLMELEATGRPGNKVFVLNLLSKSNCRVDLFSCFCVSERKLVIFGFSFGSGYE